jgi:hypothetical protein
MAEVSGIGIFRDGGTIEFRLSGTSVDSLYRLRSPVFGNPQLLLRDGEPLPPGGAVEAVVLTELRGWLAGAAVGEAAAALAELSQLTLWQNLPDRLVRVVPLHHIGGVVGRLSERVAGSASG